MRYGARAGILSSGLVLLLALCLATGCNRAANTGGEKATKAFSNYKTGLPDKASRDARFAYLGTNNFIGGRQLGKAAAGLRPDGGKYAEFVGLKTAANAIERSDGFKEGAGGKFERVEYLGDEFDLSTAQKNVRDSL